MTQQLFVPGPLPGVNDYLGRADWRHYNGHKKQWARLISARIAQAQLKPMQRARISWVWHEPSRRRDPDNFTGIGKKFVLDALVSCGILPDDGWNEIAGMSDAWVLDKARPGVTVILEECREFNKV